MCVFCAAVVADQLHKEEADRLPVPQWIAALIGRLVIASAIYHGLHWNN